MHKLLGAIAHEAPAKSILAPGLASYFEQTLPKLRTKLADLGELRSVNFYRVADFREPMCIN